MAPQLPVRLPLATPARPPVPPQNIMRMVRMTGPPRRLEPPTHYDPARKATWTDAINRLADTGGLFRADPHILDVYVEAIAAHRQASQLLAQTNVLITRGDKAVANPALAIQRQTADAIAKAAKALGLHRSPMTAALAESPMAGDGRRWCEEHQRDECKHHRKDGELCHAFQLIPGMGSCRKHVGFRLEEARERGAARLARIYTGATVDIDPAAALLWELGHSAAVVSELRAEVTRLAAEPGPDGEAGSGLFWGTVLERDRDGVSEVERRAGPHAVLRALAEERKHLVNTAAAAHTAGAQAAQIDAARAWGTSLYRLLETILANLELSPRQRDELVPVVVPAAIRAWNPEEPAEAH
jgi:P27 family predicted phage terminase small subunit